jgi:hypothetical protein
MDLQHNVVKPLRAGNGLERLFIFTGMGKNYERQESLAGR